MSRTSLSASALPLCVAYDVALLDLDGVVYIGPAAVPAAPMALARAREQGMRLAFVTNNAARTPQAVARHLSELGIPAEPEEVTTSSQAAAHYLAERLAPGSAVLVVGTTGLIEALQERGLRPVFSAEDDPAAVVQGFSPELSWPQLAEACVTIRRGVPWVATNVDATVPSPRGPLPGNGSLVASLRTATGVEPTVTGKPDPTMHRETLLRSAATRPIVVGDRLDTDIEGANAVGCASLLVFSGVSAPSDLLGAPPRHRPDFVGRDVSALLATHSAPTLSPEGVRCGAWLVRPAANVLVLASEPDRRDPAGDDLDALRALMVAAWSGPTATGDQPGCQARDSNAEQELGRLGLR